MKTQIRIDADSVIAHITPYLTGACMEDVNHEVYGGIYSQMIFGESFEEQPMTIDARLNAAFRGLSGTVSCLAERTHLADESPIRSWQAFRRGSGIAASRRAWPDIAHWPLRYWQGGANRLSRAGTRSARQRGGSARIICQWTIALGAANAGRRKERDNDGCKM